MLGQEFAGLRNIGPQVLTSFVVGDHHGVAEM
jgi:hypothetical protein